MWMDCNCGRRNTEIDPCPTCGAGVDFPGEESGENSGENFGENFDEDLAEIDPTATLTKVNYLPAPVPPIWGGTELVFDDSEDE